MSNVLTANTLLDGSINHEVYIAIVNMLFISSYCSEVKYQSQGYRRDRQLNRQTVWPTDRQFDRQVEFRSCRCNVCLK